MLENEINESDNVRWSCPQCSITNLDSFFETGIPTCYHCGYEFEWSEVLTPAQMDNFNKIIALVN